MGCQTSTRSLSSVQPVRLNREPPSPKKVTVPGELKLRPSDFITNKRVPLTRDYAIGELVGSGNYCTVRKAIHRVTGQERAVKTLRKSVLSRNSRNFLSEAKILQETSHPHILRLYEYFEDSHAFHLVTELIRGGELFEFIVKHEQLSEATARHFFKQLASALAYCHSRGIVHRDIKPENLLLDTPSENATLCVIDFGTSTLIDPRTKLDGKYGTPYYVAPEVLTGQYDEKCDIWSAGVILHILLCGSPPFDGQHESEILAKVKRGKFSMTGPAWSGISSEAKDLLRRMLCKNPKQRLPALEVLNHAWLQQVASPQVEPAVLSTFASLKHFYSNSRLQEFIMVYIASQLACREDTQALLRNFQALDKNGDGKLSREELQAAYEETGTLTQAQVDELVAGLNRDSQDLKG